MNKATKKESRSKYKDPTFPFYCMDYLVDTARWDRAMQGLHVSLMAEAWINDGLQDFNGTPFPDINHGSTDVEIWLKIKHKWYLENGRWKQGRLEREREKRRAFNEEQSRRGKLSAESRRAKSTMVQQRFNHGSTETQPKRNQKQTISKPQINDGSTPVEFQYKPDLTTVEPTLNHGSDLTTVEPTLNHGYISVEPEVNLIENENENENENIKSKKESLPQNVVFAAIFGDPLNVKQITKMFPSRTKEEFQEGFEQCWYHFNLEPTPPATVEQWKQKFRTWMQNFRSKKESPNELKRTKINNLKNALGGGENFGQSGAIGGQQLRFD